MTTSESPNRNGSTLVRVRTAGDIPACVQALKDVYAVDGYPVEGVSQAEKWLFPDGLLEAWVAEVDGDVVGHAAVSEPRDEAAVQMLVEQAGTPLDQIAVAARLFVAPKGRGNALGRDLAVAVFGYGQQHGRRIVFDVMTKDQTAIRLYERMGCIRLGTTFHQFGDNQQVPAYCYVAPVSA
ncbi:GNAT family N-acetyltransferase [Actinocatenispora sera]|uniref:GNAT family N-acetyltransferase n=1 Tax=Actinocatenispora sera TaxID=390989 RepID=UPI0033F26F4D